MRISAPARVLKQDELVAGGDIVVGNKGVRPRSFEGWVLGLESRLGTLPLVTGLLGGCWKEPAGDPKQAVRISIHVARDHFEGLFYKATGKRLNV
jgi:hypothetical protein